MVLLLLYVVVFDSVLDFCANRVVLFELLISLLFFRVKLLLDDCHLRLELISQFKPLLPFLVKHQFVLQVQVPVLFEQKFAHRLESFLFLHVRLKCLFEPRNFLFSDVGGSLSLHALFRYFSAQVVQGLERGCMQRLQSFLGGALFKQGVEVIDVTLAFALMFFQLLDFKLLELLKFGGEVRFGVTQLLIVLKAFQQLGPSVIRLLEILIHAFLRSLLRLLGLLWLGFRLCCLGRLFLLQVLRLNFSLLLFVLVFLSHFPD